ncbi:thioredoxin domain-containing protein [Streptomyces sp. NPDC089919]|uniref:thioredoxin domain-containing protein n=1 Tax=Streptomyces sp. NPDC089919 TaxID=3155188 RepID=UPI00343C2121
MAGTNKKDQRREARERLRAERAAAARKARLRGRLLVGGSLAAVLALAVGIGAYAANRSDGHDPDPEAAGKPFVRPAHTSGPDGVVVPYGKADAEHVLTVWLDPRCPYCAGVENGLGATFKEQADAGTYRIEYRFATFLDGALGGKGSKRALNALGAAVNESPEKFLAYLRVLYANHPQNESEDTFGSTATLLELADQVPGLRTPAFNKAVKELTYLPWVEKTGKAFYDSGEKGTPALYLDGKKLQANSGEGISSIPVPQWKKLVTDTLK